MPLVTLLCGPAGAGKTTYALELVAKGAHRLSMDEAVWADGWGEQQPPVERLVELHDQLKDDLRRAVGEGRDVVVDLSLAARDVRDEWREVAARAGAKTSLVVLTAPFEVLWHRVQRREGDHANSVRLNREQLRDYVDGFDWPGAEEPHRTIRSA
jgi:predicted kinase